MVSQRDDLDKCTPKAYVTKVRLKKDIVIPAGTILENIGGIKTNYISHEWYEYLVGLTDDSCGHFRYDVDSGDIALLEYFEVVE